MKSVKMEKAYQKGIRWMVLAVALGFGFSGMIGCGSEEEDSSELQASDGKGDATQDLTWVASAWYSFADTNGLAKSAGIGWQLPAGKYQLSLVINKEDNNSAMLRPIIVVGGRLGCKPPNLSTRDKKPVMQPVNLSRTQSQPAVSISPLSTNLDYYFLRPDLISCEREGRESLCFKTPMEVELDEETNIVVTTLDNLDYTLNNRVYSCEDITLNGIQPNSDLTFRLVVGLSCPRNSNDPMVQSTLDALSLDNAQWY
jgi:hypothetical protein